MATATAPAKVPAAAPVSKESAVSKLADQVKNFKEQQEATRTELLNTREELTTARQQADEDFASQLTEIDTLLEEMGSPVETPVVNGTTKNGATGRGVGPRAGNTVTVAGGVEQLLLKNKKGLSLADVVVKMQSEIGYKSGSDDPKKYTANIYTGGIVKLMTKDQKIISVGERPNTIYKHVNHATPAEIAAYKAKKK